MTEEMSSGSAQGYRVLARKYRPRNFADLIGQEAVVRTLSNAIASGRIAQAYMLTGVRGTGKTTTARLIARALNYPGQASIEMPDMTPQCQAILESRHMDVIEIDAASNTGVDDIREIIDQVRYGPVELRYKIYIIDEVHMLSKGAFNALLKTLEEPPPHVKFIFATTEIRKVPVTILSRCQRFDMRRLSVANLMQHYEMIAGKEGVTGDEDSFRLIARAAEGSVRDGLSLLDQAIAYGAGKLIGSDVATMLGLIDRSRIITLFETVMRGDADQSWQEFDQQMAGGGDAETIIADMADFVHWITRLKVVKDQALEDASRTEVEKVKGVELAQSLSMPQLTRAWQMLLKGLGEVAASPHPAHAAEMVLVRLAYAADLPQGEELLKLVQAHEGAHKSGEAAKPLPRLEPSNAQALPVMQGALAVESDTSDAPVVRHGETTTALMPGTFEQILALADEHRDIKFKTELERYVRPIRVSVGQIELALETGAPVGLTGEITRKLQAWTGARWMVLLAKDGGAAPVAQRRKAEANAVMQSVLAEPLVQAVFKKFPGARIETIGDAPAAPVEEVEDEEYR